MKKRNLILSCSLLFLLGSSFALADADDAASGRRPRLGVEAGINLASLNGPNLSGVIGSRLGFVAGGFLNLPLGSRLALQPEVLYEQKGGKINGSDYQLDYVEIPILLDAQLVGPLDILLGPSFAGTVANSGVDKVNSADVGLVLGAQVSFTQLLVSGRYEVGLSDVSSDTKIQNGTFTFLVGLSLI